VQRVYNLYGPSEDTTYSTWALLPVGTDDPVPIGQPISNTRCYVLDPSGQPVPSGVSGELYLAGAGLARGYLAQPALTAARFLPDPFSAEPGARLYRTGDLVRFLPDGRLSFLGRIDSQIKLRGYRIELGEIEATLRLHPLVHEAAVLLAQTTTGDPRLVAYVVPPTPSLSQDTLTSFLAEHLPDYMLPSMIIWMDHLPLSPNGKLDRLALPTPDWSSMAHPSQQSAPPTPLEEALLNIWQEVLGLPQLGIHENFFRLGGHSLLATRVVSQLEELFHIQMPLRTFFEAPTIAEQAAIMLQNPDERWRIERTAQLLIEIAQLSEDEVQTLMNEQGRM
jgi:acyl carrier protein